MAAMSEDEREAFRAERREAGLRINPETAIYASRYTEVLDPYGVEPLTEEEKKNGASCVGREWFVRAPENDDGWVWDRDLPEATVRALMERSPEENERLKEAERKKRGHELPGSS